MRRLLTVALLSVLLAACGGSDDGDGGGGGSANGVVTVQSLFASMEAKGVGCTGLEMVTDATKLELGAKEQGTCRLGTERLTILTYAENLGRDAANEIAKQFGGIAVLGDKWAVRVGTTGTAEKVKAALGGKID